MISENINYLNVGCDCKHKNKIEGTIWYTICSKTKKVALIGDNNIHPFVVTGTYIEDGKCFDGASCLNTDCEYCENKTMEEALKPEQRGLTKEEGKTFIEKNILHFWETQLKQFVKDNEEALENGGIMQGAFEFIR